MSSDVWAQVAIFTHFYPYVDPVGVVGVKCWDRLPCYWDMLYFGRAPRTKETLPNFR